jgi:GT2 family glycosyltransferase
MLLDLPLPPNAQGQWMRLTARSTARTSWWAKLELEDRSRGQIVREGFFGPANRHGVRSLLVHVPLEAGALRVRLFGGATVTVNAVVLSRVAAALRLFLLGYRDMPMALRGDWPGLAGRVRVALGQAPARAGQAPPYAMWIVLYEPAPAPVPANCAVQLVVVGQDQALIAASLASAGDAARTALVVRQPSDWAGLSFPAALIVGAGELLAAGALAAFAQAAAGVDAVYADVDCIDSEGTRQCPQFKPGPDRILLRSGFLTSGACLFRLRATAHLPAQAGAARLALALAADHVTHIPRILTHIMPQAEAHHIVRVNAGAQTRAAASPPRVSIIVPSACRAAHVWRCLRRVAYGTDYPDFEILLAVSDMSPDDGRQSRLLARLAALPRLRMLNLRMPDFNYATVNNLAAQEASGDMLLLLNDDVVPIAPGWLAAMVAYMQDPGIGAVGARLLYGNNTVQHGGVVMGLGNLCEHAGRFRSAADPGPHGIALMDREVSAVTAACMLVRASAYWQAGGMDSGFAIALNDVDLCLRLREYSWRIVYAATTTLYHYESLSLGRHYAGVRAGLEAVEVRRLRKRWANIIANDPYYNPNASLELGRVWQPGFPPRLAASAGTGAKPAAPC